MDELISSFSIGRVNKSGSRFDPEKARWFNHYYLQQKPANQLAIEFGEFLRARGFQFDIKPLEKLVDLVKERVSFVKDIWSETDFFFQAPEGYDQEVIKKRWREDSPSVLLELKSLLEQADDFSAPATESLVKEWIREKGYNAGAVMNVFRLVIVGASRGPHMFDIISWIGKDETINRIEKGLEIITSNQI